MYNKRVLSKAKAELNKAKAPKKSQDIITDPMGQWKYPGLPTRIPSNNITMEGVGYPVLGVGNNGQRKIMLPGAEYTFPGADYVDEYPQMKKGGERKRRKTKSLSGTNKLMQQNPLLRNYKNREFDPNVDYFQDGGMKTVKSKDGTVTNKFTNANGDTVIQVKTKDGKYSEKIIPASTNTNKNTFVKYDKNLDTSLIPSESTYVNNPVVSKLPEFVTKGMINYIKDENKKKQERLIQEVKKDNNNVVEYYKGYHDSPRYKEMLQKSDPENWEDIYDSRNANLEGYDPGSFINYYLPKKSFGREYTDKTRLFISNTQPKDEPNTGGDSNSETGLIRIFPKGYGGKGMLAHEYSHSIDRPAGGSGHYIKPRFDWYENKTPYDPNNRLIPKKDKDWINKHRPIDFYESPEFKKASPAEKKYYLDNRHMYWDRNKEWYDYVGEDTETRARLNDIRYQSKKRGIYDPYTQKVNNKTFKKVLKTKYETGDKEGFDALKQLQDVYSDDEIQWMLNNISKKEDKNTDIPYAQDGGEYIEAELTDDEIEEYRKGGYIIEDISVPELNQAQKGKFIAPSLPIDRTKSETTQMFQPIVKNAIRDKNVVRAREIEERKRNIDRGVKAVKNSIAAIEKNKTYTKKQKTELLKKETDKLFNIDQTQLEETGAVLNQTDQHTIKAAPEKTVGDYAERTWDIITNPFDAAKYSISGGGIENMPWNYNKMKELGIDPSARSYQERFSGSDQKSNMVGDVLNSFNLADAGDKVYRNVSKGNWEDAALEATRFLEVGAFMKPNTLKKIATAIPSNPKQLLRKVEDNRGLNKVVEALTEGSIKLFNPFDNLAQRFVGKTSAEDIKRKISMLNAGSSVRDLKKGEKAFNKIKDESLEFWKTDEGRRRVQKYLDENELTKYGIDVDQYIDMMNDVKYIDDSTVKDTRNVMVDIDSERKKIQTKKQKINDEITKLVRDGQKKSPEGWVYMDRSVEDQIDKLTEELDNLNNIDYGHIESLNNLPSVPTNNAYYSPLNSAGDNSKVFIGEDFLSDAALDQTAYHEWGHAKHLQPHMILAKYFPGYTNQFADSGELSKTRPLNKRLREGLDMESDDYLLDKDKLPMHLQNEENYNKLYRNASAVSGTGKARYTNPEQYWFGERKYFDHNDEANTFLQELIPELKKRGYIQKFGDHIEPQMIADLFNEYRTEASQKIIEPVRLLDIVKPTGKSIHRITEELNNLHTLLIGAGGAGAAGATLSDDEESEPVYEKGGIVTELSEDEIQDYINQGYVVEEVDSPKMQTGGQLPYQVWQEKTGTSWAEAKRQGLTDGSASGNIALMNKLLAGETPTVGSNNTPRATPVQSNSGYDAYDRNVKQMVSNGASLEDLVNIRMGTKEGLVNRFPDLFSASNAKSKEVNKINIPQNKKTIATKVDAIVNKPDTQSVKSIVPQLKTIPAESTITRIPAPKVVAPIVKKFEKSKVKVEQKLQQKDTEDMVNRIREQLTPDSLKKQQLIKSDVISYKPQIQPKPQIKKQIPPITKQDTFKPIITDTNKGPEIIKPVQIKSPIDVKKPLAVKTPQQIIDTQNYLKPVVKFKKGSKLTEQKPEEESKIVKEDADYKVINNLTQRLNKFDESLQGLYYDYTNPHNTSEKRKQATQTFKNKIAERNNLINTINSKKRDYAGGIDSWVDESAPAWIKKPAQKWDLSDQVETTSYKLPTLQTYKEKEEQDNEKFRTTKRFDDLGGTEKGSRWQFRVSASNDDPMKVQLYGTRAERNPNLNIKSKGAVMHFLDQSPLTGYVHPTTKAYYRDLKQDAYVGKLEKLQDGTYGVKYVPKKDIPAKDLTKNTFLVRQEKFDNIDFNKKVGDDNFSGHTYWTKKGTERATIPVSSGKDANVYDYSSGQSVVFIFPYKGKTRYVHYAGSPNAIKKEGEEIKKLYKLQANKLVLGVADAGSYSSSVKGNITDKKLKDWNYGYANRNSFTGAGMALVD